MNSAFYRTVATLRVPTAATLLLALAACKSADIIPKIPGVTPYRMEIQQGNFISQEMVAQLKPGMTREQVRFVLGTPLVADIFHADRWDYVFYRETSGGKREQRNLSVVFEKDRLARVIGDLMPADAAAPQATGFDPQVKPAKPAAAAVPTIKPAADAPKPAAEALPPPGSEPAKPAAETAKAESKPEAKPEAKPETKPEEAKAETKPAEPTERGFFGRMMEKIGL
jgi:outer membrane protein assembly factor BamE